MNILTLEPYYGGSHQAFIDGLSRASTHNWTVLTLPAHKWKWRMRHSAITFAGQVTDLLDKGQCWDLIFCSDMLNLAEFTALVPAEVARLPKVLYFHENQLTYPVRFELERDYQFAMTNFISALAADAVWFNSQFHLDSFLEALVKFLKSMPDFQPLGEIEHIRRKAAVYSPGIGDFPKRSVRKTGPLHILWAARWEHDKNPDDFFEALEILKNNDVHFNISVIGQSFRDQPEVFEKAQKELHEHIVNWGFQKTRKQYEHVLNRADVIVSTAKHEFFGITVLEAIAAGAYPLLPDRLSYPEILGLGQITHSEQFLYDGTVKDLAARLSLLAERLQVGHLWPKSFNPENLVAQFTWRNLIQKYDKALEQLCRNSDKKS